MKMPIQSTLIVMRRTTFAAIGICLVAGSLLGVAPWAELRAQSGYTTIDLALSASPSVAQASKGTVFDLTYEVSNAGPATAHDVVIAYSGTKNFTVLSTYGCQEDPYPAATCTVNLPVDGLAPGSVGEVVFNIVVGPRAKTSMTIEAMASAAEVDDNPGNEYNATTIPIVP